MSEKKIGRQHVIGRLLTSAVYHDDVGYWQTLTDEKVALASYFEQMGVRLEVDTDMGMGYLRPTNQAEEEEFSTAGYAPLPKIIPPRILGYYPSLLCALLREALQHHEENSLDSKHLYLDESQTQRDTLKKDPALARLSSEIAIARADLKQKEKDHDASISELSIAEHEETKNLEQIERLKPFTTNTSGLEEPLAAIGKRTKDTMTDVHVLQSEKAELHKTYTEEIGQEQVNADKAANAAVAKMGFIISHPDWGHLHDELNSVPPESLTEEAIGRFQRVETRIKKDDIPKNEEKFRRLLQENVISDFNTFRTSLENMEQTIITRVSSINTHLAKVDFDRREGLETYIRLIPEKTKDQVVRDFRVQLNTALKDILNIDEDIAAREKVFHQVDSLIDDLDRDPKRREHVIDVRNWFDFKAEERFRQPDRPKETYQGAIGKSGGEKSRLASTILATAIAYQYDIEIDRPEGDTFRFVLIDEALSRIGDEFSAYLFEVFARFHLQLLIIHPRDAKLHITERFVRRYNVALKPERYSSVVNMTVHEFQEYKTRFAST